MQTDLDIDTPTLARAIREVPDFPRAGIAFKDITPLLADPVAFGGAVAAVAGAYGEGSVDKVAGIEARGLILAAPVALQLGVGFVPLRKAGKLPAETVSVRYELEYGFEHLEAHADAFAAGERVAIIDDVLATGGTASAAAELVEGNGAAVAGFAFIVELGFLDGASRLAGYDHVSLLRY
jgi:adenine phosphoribosyltransferase